MKRILYIILFITCLLDPMLSLAHGEQVAYIFGFIFLYLLIGSLIIAFIEYGFFSYKFKDIPLETSPFIGYNYIIVGGSSLLVLLITPTALTLFDEKNGSVFLISILIIFQTWIKYKVYKLKIFKKKLIEKDNMFLFKFIIIESLIINILIIYYFSQF